MASGAPADSPHVYRRQEYPTEGGCGVVQVSVFDFVSVGIRFSALWHVGMATFTSQIWSPRQMYYHSLVLEEITNKKPSVFRAGGWCVQPFNKFAEALYKYGIRIDSTVFPEGKNFTNSKSFDFTNTPIKNNWRFSNDPLIEVENGNFSEIPISSVTTTPFFYFKFIINKYFGGIKQKSFGDGASIRNSKKQIFCMLLKSSCSVASIDGYKSSLLDKCAKQNREQLVLIGHPKAFSPFSLKELDSFIYKRRIDSVFVTYCNYNE